jgi:8-oxo-dGTP pyrophosphatase MutT (NUDIX family)
MTAVVWPAATAVLVREHSGEVLLVLRNARHGFMASVWVFPGGRVDEADVDHAATLAATPDETIADAGAGTTPEGGLRRAAFLCAAVRETFEEAGILLTEVPRTIRADEPRDFAAALAGESSRSSSLSKLEPFARWVTPPSEKKRFDTIFFCGLVPDLEAVADDGEVVEARWLHPALALAEHRAGRLPLAPPTLLTLHSLLAAAYAGDDGYDPHDVTHDPPRCWSSAHAQRLMRWVGGVADWRVKLSPSLAFSEGKLVVAPEPWSPWPVPGPLSRLRDIRLVDGHWELVFLADARAPGA